MRKEIYYLTFGALLCSNLLVAQKNEEILKDYFNNSARYKKIKTANKEFTIKTEEYSSSMKSTVLQVQQTFSGIPIYNSYGNALIKDDKLVSINENFYKSAINYNQPKSDKPDNIFSKAINNASIKKGNYSLTEKDKPNSVFSQKIYFP